MDLTGQTYGLFDDEVNTRQRALTTASQSTTLASTIADFRCRHEHALSDVFSGVLGLCARVGLASVGVVSIDGTKMSANASMNANRDYLQIARAILREAGEIDEREDELYGDARGDELPEQLRTREGRRRALHEAKERLNRERDQAAGASDGEDDGQVELELDPQRFVTRPQGRRAWLREGRRAPEAQREREGRPIADDRAERLFEACRRLEQELDADRAANAAYEHWRAHGVAADGSRRMAPGMVKPFELPELPTGLMNVTDPDSSVVRTQGQPGMQGYNAQLAVNDGQIIVAAEITTESPDFGHLEPMVRATQRELAALGLGDPDVVLADAGYWHQRQMQQDRRRGHPSTRPARRRVAQRRAAGLDRRHVLVHVPRARDTTRPRPLSPTPDHDRARLRPDQVQPRDHTLPPPRQNRVSQRMETDRSDPQPAQAPPPPTRRRDTLTAAAPRRRRRLRHSLPRRADRTAARIYPTASPRRSSVGTSDPALAALSLAVRSDTGVGAPLRCWQIA
jgi:hypothetical protein